jgi:hypothetical protein
MNPVTTVAMVRNFEIISGNFNAVAIFGNAEGNNVQKRDFSKLIIYSCQSQWPRGLRHGSAAVSLLGLWARIPPAAWMSVSCQCCVLSGRGLFVGLITRPEESYRV